MPRRDRTFSHFDMVRIACRNLSPIEQSAFRAQIRGVLGDVNTGMDSILSMICTLDKAEASEFYEKMCADPCGFKPVIDADTARAAFGNLDRAYWTAYRRAFLMEVLTQRKQDWHVFTQADMKAVFTEIFTNTKSTHYINKLHFCEWLIPINNFTAQSTNFITTLQFLPIAIFALIAIFPVSMPFLMGVNAAIFAYEEILTLFNLAFIAINAFFVFLLIPIMGCGDFGTGVPKYFLPETPQNPDLSGIQPYGNGQ